MRTHVEKFQTVIEKNTFFYFDNDFEEEFESYINLLSETLLVLKNKIDSEGALKKEFFEELLSKENGLKSVLAITGISNEFFRRLITFIRVVDDTELNELVCKENWEIQPIKSDNISEWGDEKVASLIKDNYYFRKGLVNLFFEGATIPIVSRALPLFELKKLSISKLDFNINSLVDTLVRYKEKGSYSGKKANNAEKVIQDVLEELNIPYEQGDLEVLKNKENDTKRTMDFIIPSKNNPLIIIESSFLSTTSSGQGDKAKTEIAVSSLIKKHCPNSKFIGFVDGIGWYVRKNDLKRMVAAFEDVYTFHDEEIGRFKELLLENKNLIKEFGNGS